MKNSQYLSDLQQSMTLLESSNPPAAQALQKFQYWLTSSTKVSILLSDLIGSENSVPLTLVDVEHIVEQSYLRPHRSSKANDLYHLSHPKIGEITHAISVMTDYVLATIRRRKYKEISEESFSRSNILRIPPPRGGDISRSGDGSGKNKLRKITNSTSGESGLGWKYHLYDMLGRGEIERVERGGLQGPMLRLKKK
jgi:hypothetical protein